MAGFDAATVVEELTWDFSKFGAGKGVVPEPTDKAIEQLFKDVAAAYKKATSKVAGLDPGKVSETELMAALVTLPDDADVGVAELMDDLARAYAKVCTNSPNMTQLKKLPMRVRVHFFAWLGNELRPEVSSAGTISPVLANGTMPPAFSRMPTVSGVSAIT